MSSIGSAESDNQWKVVSRHDKKRVIHKSSKNAGHTCTNDCSISSTITKTVSSSYDIHYVNKLYECIENCCNDIIQTDLYNNFIRYWKEEFVMSLFSDNDNNDSPLLVPVVQEIVCYGIGTFSETSFIHYNASLYQLAFILSIRKFLMMSNQYPVVNDTPCDDDVNEHQDNIDPLIIFKKDENSLLSCPDINNNKSTSVQDIIISMTYYDPCMTTFEKEFLHQKFDFCNILENNERGNHRIISDDVANTTTTGSTQKNQRQKNIILFFMPHCPAQLYENVIWSHWDHIVAPEPTCVNDDTKTTTNIKRDNMYGNNIIVIIGNSLREIAERKCSEVNKPKQCLQLLLPWLQQIPLRTSKDDKKTFPGNIVGAFNDTYLSYWNTWNTSSQNELIHELRRPSKNLDDDVNDMELL